MNVSQLSKAQAAATTKVTGNQGVSIENTKNNDDGSTTYTIAAKTDGTTVKVDGNGNIAAVTSAITTNANGVANATTPASLATAGDIATAINKSGFNIVGAGNNAGDAFANELINPGDTVTLEAGKNLTVAQSNGRFVFATANEVEFASVITKDAAGNTTSLDGSGIVSEDTSGNVTIHTAQGSSVITADGDITTVRGQGVTITPTDGQTVSLTTTGLNNGNNKITNVAKGTEGTDAVNVSQLNNAVAGSKESVVSADKTVTVTPTIDKTTGATTFDLAVNTGSSLKVDGKTGAIDVNTDGTTITTDPTTGTIKANTTTLTTTDGKVNTPANTGALATAGDVVKAINQSGFNIIGAGNDGGNGFANELINPGDTVTLQAGKNLTVAQTKGQFVFATKDEVEFDQVTVGPLVISQDTGINAGNTVISNVAAGTKDTDAVNVSQLTKAQNAATTKVEAGSNIVVKTHKNADGSTKYTVSTADNLTVDSVKTGDTIMNNDGIKVGDKVALTNTGLKVGDVSVSSTGINAGGNKVTGVAKGDITQNSTDAVNGSQLYAVQQVANAAKTEIKAGENITVHSSTGQNNQTIYTVNAKDTSASVTAGSDAVTVTKSASARVGTADVTDYKVDLSQATKNDIAKGVEAKNIVDNKGLTFNGDSGTTGIKKLGDSVAIKGDDNITTKADANGLQVTLNKEVAVDTVTTGNTVIGSSGITIKSPTQDNPNNTVALTQSGLNNGGQRITNVAPGVDATDAVNVNQLNEIKKIVTGGNAGTNITTQQAITGNAPPGTVITTFTNPDGSTTTTTETNQTVVVSTDKGGKDYYLTTYNVEGQNTYVTNDVIQAIGKMNEQGIKFFHTNDGEVKPAIQGSNNVDSSASGKFATAVGYQTVADGDNAVAMGNTYVSDKKIEGAQVTEIADGNGEKRYAQVTKATGKNAIALGTGSQALAENTIAIGTGNVVTGKNSGAIGDPSIVTGNNSYAVGNNNTISSDDTFVVGNEVKQTLANSVVLGSQSAAVEVNTATKKQGTYTYAGINDANVSGVEDVVGVVSVGAEGQTRQIQNVAAGVVSANSTDAINGSQLYDTHQAIGQLANQTVSLGNQLNHRINDVADDANAGVSSAMAMAALPQAYIPGKSMLTGGIASYNGEGAVAVGLSKLSDNGRWVLKVSGTADTQGNAGGAVGAGFHF